MASGINFNPASFQIAGKTPPVLRQAVEQPVANPSDGFQSSGVTSQAPVANPTAPAGVTLKVTAQELASAAFQQSLQTLSSAGIPVSIVLMNAAEAPPQPGGNQGGVGRQEFSDVQSTVNQHGRQISRLEEQYGNIATPPKPSYKPPTYGGD